MIKKAKTKKNIFAILSAVLGAVFAFIMGVTYCASPLFLYYRSDPGSTTTYAGNQQYHIINDTLSKPVPFGQGAHNFEIALQYAFDYDFDVRFEYSLSWSGGETYSTDNVILNFANRDNIIYDDNYIYLANSVASGNSKIAIITGVEFVNVNDETYVGQTLTITMTAKVYKAQDAYSSSNILCVEDSVASDAWLQYKENITAADNEETDAYVLMYNYRRNYGHGVPYPGAESAYKKPWSTEKHTVENQNGTETTYEADRVYGAVWTGGNRAYAGIGMYVISGSTPVELEVKVTGIWRDNSGDGLTTPETLIYENNIQYNYATNWINPVYDSNKLFETRTYKYTIPTDTACYIEIFDSIEITSAGTVVANTFDSYRLVTNEIVVNPSLGESGQTTFSYAETTDGYMQFKPININSDLVTVTDDTQKSVSVVNTSNYTNGLYDVSNRDEQTFNTNISLINNTAQAKVVTLSYNLYYHISNGSIYFTDDTTGERGNSFAGNLYYSITDDINEYLTSTLETSVTIAPYSSVNVVESYKVSALLRNNEDTAADDSLREIYDDTTTAKFIEEYDVWVYLVPSVTSVANASYTSTSTGKTNLSIESTFNGTTLTLSLKNNTNYTVNAVNIKNLKVMKLTEVNSSVLTDQPADWEASFWKYYDQNNEPLLAYKNFESSKYYLKTKSYTSASVTQDSTFASLNSTSKLGLQPGESIVIGTASVSAVENSQTVQKNFLVYGFAEIQNKNVVNADSLMLINDGKKDACLVNYSTSSYYVSFGGTYTGADVEYIEEFDGVNYYIGIVRPGQIISVSGAEDLDSIPAGTSYSAATISSWHSSAVALMTSLFTTNY